MADQSLRTLGENGTTNLEACELKNHGLNSQQFTRQKTWKIIFFNNKAHNRKRNGLNLPFHFVGSGVFQACYFFGGLLHVPVSMRTFLDQFQLLETVSTTFCGSKV